MVLTIGTQYMKSKKAKHFCSAFVVVAVPKAFGRTCGFPDLNRGAITVCQYFYFEFSAKKKSFQKKMKRLLSGWQDSNLRPSRFKAGRANRATLQLMFKIYILKISFGTTFFYFVFQSHCFRP